MTNSRTGSGNTQEHFVVLECKKVLKYETTHIDGDMSKRQGANWQLQ